jgi:hypothetical protein
MPRTARLTLFAVLATLLAPPAQAPQEATRVTGTVVDSDGRSLKGASVEILGTDRRAVTGASGAYRIDVQPGRYWILTRRVGYAPVRVAVTLDDLEAIEIYRRGFWVPTEFTFRDGGGCGLVVVWLR